MAPVPAEPVEPAIAVEPAAPPVEITIPATEPAEPPPALAEPPAPADPAAPPAPPAAPPAPPASPPAPPADPPADSPSDVLPPEPVEVDIIESCGPACDAPGCCSGGKGGCGAAAPWKMPQPCCLQKRGIMVGGWLQQGITFNGHNPSDGLNGTVGTNDWDAEYQMNQLWLYLTRPIDNGGHGWGFGGHVDMIFGTDWRFGINNGLETEINQLDNDYGLVIPQFYAEVAYNNLSVKIGHQAGILDYEAVPAVANPFYSHSLSYGFTVPQLVTGVMANYQITDQFSFQGGFHRGWMQFEDINDDLDVMVGVKFQSASGKTSLAYAISSGAQDPAGANDRFVSSLVLKRTVTENLQYVAVQNVGFEDNTGIGGTDAEWYGLNQYFLYKINACWSANLRVEWLRDDDGAIVHGPPAPVIAGGLRAWPGSGYAGDFYELTAGLAWRPCPNLVVRPECRWDWYNGAASAGPQALPYNVGADDDQFTFGVDAILTF